MAEFFSFFVGSHGNLMSFCDISDSITEEPIQREPLLFNPQGSTTKQMETDWANILWIATAMFRCLSRSDKSQVRLYYKM